MIKHVMPRLDKYCHVPMTHPAYGGYTDAQHTNIRKTLERARNGTGNSQ